MGQTKHERELAARLHEMHTTPEFQARAQQRREQVMEGGEIHQIKISLIDADVLDVGALYVWDYANDQFCKEPIVASNGQPLVCGDGGAYNNSPISAGGIVRITEIKPAPRSSGIVWVIFETVGLGSDEVREFLAAQNRELVKRGGNWFAPLQ